MFFLPSDLFHFIYFPFLILYTLVYFSFFFFNDTATTEIYTLSLHDALPISLLHRLGDQVVRGVEPPVLEGLQIPADGLLRGERGWSRDGRPHAGEERECAERPGGPARAGHARSLPQAAGRPEAGVDSASAGPPFFPPPPQT